MNRYEGFRAGKSLGFIDAETQAQADTWADKRWGKGVTMRPKGEIDITPPKHDDAALRQTARPIGIKPR